MPYVARANCKLGGRWLTRVKKLDRDFSFPESCFVRALIGHDIFCGESVTKGVPESAWQARSQAEAARRKLGGVDRSCRHVHTDHVHDVREEHC